MQVIVREASVYAAKSLQSRIINKHCNAVSQNQLESAKKNWRPKIPNRHKVVMHSYILAKAVGDTKLATANLLTPQARHASQARRSQIHAIWSM